MKKALIVSMIIGEGFHKERRGKMANHTIRSRDMMYTTDLDKLDNRVAKLINYDGQKYNCNALLQYLMKCFPGDKISVIVHDHDVKRDSKTGKPLHDSNGNEVPRTPHLHVARHHKSAVAISGLAKAMCDDKTQNVAAFNRGRGNANEGNMFSYQYHRTEGAQALGKYQYSFDDGSANFDVKSIVKSATEKAKATRLAKRRKSNDENKNELEELTNELLEKVRTGEVQLADMSYNEDLQRVYARNKSVFESMSDVWLENVIKTANLLKQYTISADPDSVKKAEACRQKLKKLHAKPHSSDSYYICGAAGSGKSFLAQRIGEAYDDDDMPRGVYIASGKEHQFDNFNQQYSVVLDDLRSDTYSAETLLPMLDNNQTAKYLDARYKGSRTADLRCLALTNTNNLDEFIRYIPDKTENGLAEDQYFRRFRKVFYVEKPEELLADKKLLVKYITYDVKHSNGIGKEIENGYGFSPAYQKAKHEGYRGLRIWRRDRNENGSERTFGDYHLAGYSDYYLQKSGEGQIEVPIAKLDKDVAPTHERQKLHDMLKKQTKMAIADSIRQNFGFDLNDVPDENILTWVGKSKKANEILKVSQAEQEELKKKGLIEDKKKASAFDKPTPIDSMNSKLPWE